MASKLRPKKLIAGSVFSKMGPRGAQEAPRGLQEAPRGLPRGSKRSPRGPKKAPRGARRALREDFELPKSAQDRSKGYKIDVLSSIAKFEEKL